MLRHHIRAVISGAGNRGGLGAAPSAWDITTSKYLGISASVATEELTPAGATLGDNGTKMYVVGPGNATVYQYTLGTAWDMNTASYASKSKLVTTETTQPYEVAFNPTGTKMFVLGNSANNIFQYTLSTGWDVSTASYDTVFATVSAQDVSTIGMEFSADGSKLYIAGNANDTIFQYTVGTPWDMTTVSYASKSLSVFSETITPNGLAFGDNGNIMFVVGNGSIHQYTLGTAWDVSTGVYASKSKAYGAEDSSVFGIDFRPDGSRLYLAGSATDSILQFDMNQDFSSWDISSATYSGLTKLTSAHEFNPFDVAFNPELDAMYIIGKNGDRIWQYSFTNDGDISSSNTSGTAVLTGTEEATATGVTFSSDGTQAYIIGSTNSTVYQYTLSTAWDVSTGVYASKSKDVSTEDTTGTSVTFADNGTKMYISGIISDSIHQYTLSTAWDVSTASYDSKAKSIAEDTAPHNVAISPDGATMLVLGNATDTVYQYTLSTPFDVSTASYDAVSIAIAEDAFPTGLAISYDSSKMFVVGNTSKSVYQYNL